ncbi:HPP family protein [Coccidioides immitis RS]|uniref:HPP family protein n=2 Tax=Coccidioides immitis TaxID=5501 RepID=J3K7E5_COCIM|nr:HPP family protein [Coccidioides immitis RS]EAS30616.3 HPP family protein [Coccidioides immitis RS]KMP03172.1 hypothetical protein CIRG_02864 [Coccidioides immitis RMSCC 2394]TPX23545.1 hypothetical protein DIZ76_012879 [Coccidioides immitis]
MPIAKVPTIENFRKFHTLEVDIDRFLNRYVPHPRWHLLPRPVAHFLGHRLHPPKKVGNVLVMLWSLIGVFTGLLIVTAVSTHIPSFRQHGAPIIVGSFGAAAVLEYCAIESPLAQPRNALFGQFFSALVGICIAKLFSLNPNHETLYWIAGPIACAAATLVMIITKTIHPPAGATGLLAVVDPTTRRLGWFLLPIVLLSSVLILASALLFNNIQRRFPLHWWTPESLLPTVREKDDGSTTDANEENPSSLTLNEDKASDDVQIMIKAGQISVTDSIILTPDEKEFLERLSRRI